jgi:hypothetical protein
MFLSKEALMMIHTKETLLLKSQEQFQELLDFVEECSSGEVRIDQVERGLFSQLLALGHTLLQKFVSNAGTGDEGESSERNGQTWRRLPNTHPRRYVSIFGELTIERTVYGTRETQKIEASPLDEKLALPAGEFSYVLEDWQQRMCLKDSFAESMLSLEALLGLRLSVRTIEDMNQRLAEHAETFRQAQEPPAPADEGELLVFTADGKGVVMRKPDQPEQPAVEGDEAAGKKGTRRMAYVGATYSIDPFVRTADDVLDELRRRQRQQDRPAPVGKRLWAEMTRLVEGEPCSGRTVLFGEMADDLTLRNPDQAKTVVCLMDGERALWDAKETFLSDAVGILDLFHVLERLHDAAQVFHSKDSKQAQAFVDERLRMLLQGKVGRVIGGLRQMISKHKITGERRRMLNKVIGYFENNRAHMKYDEYLAAGHPIGSGVAEGACRHLVKDRMERTGMRWRLPRAQAMLHLRAIYLNGDWDDFIEHRIQHQQETLYYTAA